MPIEIESSRSNVFEDLALPDATGRLAKAELARAIRKIVADRGWTQRRAAEALGIAPPDMSDLVRGKLARFSQERLGRFLNALEMDVCIQVGPKRRGKQYAIVTVDLIAVFKTRGVLSQSPSSVCNLSPSRGFLVPRVSEVRGEHKMRTLRPREELMS